MRSSIVFFTVSLIVLVPFEAYADYATQSSWSGGPGFPGPVSQWGDEFHLDNGVEWRGSAGSVTLLPVMHTVDSNFYGARCVYSEDIDGDGDMDILGAAYSSDAITWWENVDGFGTVWIEENIAWNFDGACCVYSEDIDGDGDLDVLGAAMNDNAITWWENVIGSGIIWEEHTVDGDFDAASSVYSEDIDGDGDMDVLGTSLMDDKITWWENTNGLGTSWVEHTIDDNFTGARSVYSEDIDGDGDKDVLGAASSADDITWWENANGLGTSWVEHTIDGDFDGARSVYSEDIDDDGDMDVLGAASSADDITWWENSDTAPGIYWIEHTVDEDFDGAWSVYSEDIDGDGDMDVLGAARDGFQFLWWENINGSGTSWSEHTVDGYSSGAASVYSEDMNNDGRSDILCASGGGICISWWDITQHSPEGSLRSSIIDTGGDNYWDYLDWNATTPQYTSVSFQVRASDNHLSMGVWSDTLTSPCSLTGILTDEDRYLQYRAILSTSDPDTTSILNDITISWNPFGIGDNPQVTEYLLFGAEPNPASGPVSICFAVPEPSPVELSIYDLTGRLVRAPSHGEYSTGVHQVQFAELNPGIYFCRMRTGDFTAMQRFAVIE